MRRPWRWILYYSFGEQVDFFTQIPDVSAAELRSSTRKAFDPAYFPTFRRTLKISIIGTFLCLVVALPFAYWLAVKVPPKWRGLLLGIVLVPFWTNFLVRTIGWQIILSPERVRVDDSCRTSDSLSEPLGLVVHAARCPDRRGLQLPAADDPAAVRGVRPDRSGACARPPRTSAPTVGETFTQVTLPIAMPGVIAGMLLVFIPLMGDYITAILLGCAKGSMAGQLVASQFDSTFDWSLGSAMAVHADPLHPDHGDDLRLASDCCFARSFGRDARSRWSTYPTGGR